jgi:hypothetical protein
MGNDTEVFRICIPRVSGGEPIFDNYTDVNDLYSPRERG